MVHAAAKQSSAPEPHGASAPEDGGALPVPTNPPAGGTLAFLMATMGACASAFVLSIGLVAIGRDFAADICLGRIGYYRSP